MDDRPNPLGETDERYRRFVTEEESRNVFWLAIPSLGESWHHNHHAFPRSADNALRWWQIDISGLVIRAMARVGLARGVVRITPERQRERERRGVRRAATPRSAQG